uniref:condensation domain-containing protein n=1 Tax=Actinoalloteichus spitiensis TaxID=252394 RepID=UPI00036F4DD1
THPLSGPRCWVLAPGELIAGPGTTRARAGHGLAGTATPGPPPRQPSAPADPTSPDHAAAQPGGDTASHHRPARTTTLDWLRGTLTALLHADGVSAEDDYFALGGNSIIAVQLVDLVAERYGVRPKLVEIYQHPRVGDFARYLDEALPTPDPGPHHCRHDPAPPPPPAAATPAGGTDRRGLPRLPPVEPGDELVLSFGQERMWFHHQLDPNTTLYNLPTTGRVRGELDIDALRQTWEDLAQRHEVLRSNFVESADGPVLVLRPMLGDFLHVVDVSGTADPVAAARPVVRAAADHVFDLAKDPLVRVLIVRLGEEDHVVQTTMHHAVNDGASPGIFRAEVNDFYRARRAGREHRFPPLPVQYRDYARWQRKLDADGLLDHELDYWRATLRGAPRLDLPLDHPRPASRDYSGAISPFTVPPDVAQRLRALARRESVTLFVVLLAAWYLLLARLSRQRDITVGTPTAGRGRPELWGLVGFFNGTVALRADLSDGPALPELLTRVRDIVLGALEHQEIPFDRVVNDLGGARDLSRNPLFDVFFIHQEQPAIQPIGDSPVEFFDERTVENLFGGLPPGTSKFDLTLVTSDREGEDTISGCLEYSTELFDGGTIAGWAVAYQQLLAGLAAAVDAHDPFGTLSKLLPAGSPGGRTPNAGQPATAALDAWTRVLRDRSANIQRRLSRTPGTRPPADPVPVVERHERRVPADVVRRARDLHPDDEDLFLTVLAASQVALARRHDQRDVLVGVAGADTSAPAPVRLRVHDDHTFRELVGRTTVAVEGVTGGTVRADLLADRLDLAVNSLPDLFDLRHQRLHRDGPPPRVGLDGLTLSSGVTTGGELVLLVERCGGSTGHDRAKALADDLADLLPALVREPGQPLRDHPLPDHRTRPGSR